MPCPYRYDKNVKTDSGIEKVCVHYIPYNSNQVEKIGFCKRSNFYRCIDDLSKNFMVLSCSSLFTYLRCKRAFWFKRINGIELKPKYQSIALKMGVLWDLFLQGKKEEAKKVIETYEIDDISLIKLHALTSAYLDLEIKTDLDCEVQNKFTYLLAVEDVEFKETMLITGVIDRRFFNYFEEDKLSSNPDYYSHLFNVNLQLGTYFLANSSFDHAIMKVVRLPGQRQETKYKALSNEEYEHKIYLDIIGRPSYYFIGFDRNKRTYGKKFHRAEFNLEELKARYVYVSKEIKTKMKEGFDAFYKQETNCTSPFPCDYIDICKTNNTDGIVRITDEMYCKSIKENEEQKGINGEDNN